ncbi:epidermal differentiation-specific protein-like [Trichomycterus rosablanca]|uniref:epidermal differentiation-specific protein-like n=1 Tax=Trichomycterus rosablanca TaxID=2290929 RepID=UPI002F358A3A
MNKIVVYEHINFQGRSKEFTSAVPDLINEGFNDIISSVKVFGKPWLAFHDNNFKGEEYVFAEGEYGHVPVNDVISSLKIVNDDLSDPKITLYELPNYQGRSIVLNAETCLSDVDFNDTASSHRVQRGIWVLYEHTNREGAQMVAKAGQDVPQYTKLNKQVSHVRPVTPGRVEEYEKSESAQVQHFYVLTVG